MMMMTMNFGDNTKTLWKMFPFATIALQEDYKQETIADDDDGSHWIGLDWRLDWIDLTDHNTTQQHCIGRTHALWYTHTHSFVYVFAVACIMDEL
mmetsp:Transcript_11402/g.17449  ORF Transcript_11402/g.17449 Transcript_11402/m.17449 type:complete len:95 (+) Transcript_11402:2-286(+)